MAKSLTSASLILCILYLCSQVNRVVSVDGRLFFLGYPDPTPKINPNSGFEEIHISGSQNVDTKVRVQVMGLNLTYMYMLNSTNSWRRTLTIWQDLAGPPGTVIPVSVVISSQAPISVQTCKAEDGTTGGYLVLPITQYSTTFYIASYTPRNLPANSFSVAAADYTCVTVYATKGTQSYREQDISLDPGQIYHFQTPSNDTTGWHVTAAKPIAVYSGLDCAYVPYDISSVQSCDYIVEQLQHINNYGQSFMASSFYGRNFATGYQIRVVSQFSGNVVRYQTCTLNPSGAPSCTANTQGVSSTTQKFVEITVGRAQTQPTVVMITCSVPCEVMQYGESYDMTGGGASETNKPDPVMVTVPAFSQYTNDITFSTSKMYSASGNLSIENVNGITIIAKTSDVPNLLFDGQPLASTTLITGMTSTSFSFPASLDPGSVASIPTVPYSVVTGGISPGFHRLTTGGGNPNTTYMAFVYGHAPPSSQSSSGYAYLGGMFMDPQNGPPVLSGPWFDFSAPVSEIPVPMNQPNNPGNPTTPITGAPVPEYVGIFVGEFFVLKPQFADLRTRNCSEAYEKYYYQYRWFPMVDKIKGQVAQQCRQGMNVTLTHRNYYSQYTEGKFTFQVSVSGAGDCTLNDVMDCVGVVGSYVGVLQNWIPQQVDDPQIYFLHPDAPYNQGCAVLHMKDPELSSNYYGWNCPYPGGVMGGNSAPHVRVSLGLLSLLLLTASFLLQLR